MVKKFFILIVICLMSLSLMSLSANAQQKISGPWLWMIAPTDANQGGQASTDIDSLDEASDGDVTEEEVAKKGAKEGDEVGNYEWTLGTLANDGDINALVVSKGMDKNADLNDITSYALIVLETKKAQNGVSMGASSDDSIKIWLNGEVVHKNAVNRGRGGANTFQDNFKVDLKKGNNLLMVKVSERGGGWGMFIGVGGDYEINDIDAVLPVEPMNKLTTRWAKIKNNR
ncbi:hypothetical protein JT359_19805 [Candidatus Poribacteria bacterium]|nr:hypothetical protein [Candidatus Poribacteria bacterium]